MKNLMKLSVKKKYGIYLLGASREILEKVLEWCRVELPSLRVSGYHDGYFTEEEENQIVEDIKTSKADILFVAISSPKKELFLDRNLSSMEVPFVMGVGGSFDVIAGKAKRAPIWMQRIGLEWFYRFMQEPGRMWKRYLFSNIKYMGILIKARFSGKYEL